MIHIASLPFLCFSPAVVLPPCGVCFEFPRRGYTAACATDQHRALSKAPGFAGALCVCTDPHMQRDHCKTMTSVCAVFPRFGSSSWSEWEDSLKSSCTWNRKKCLVLRIASRSSSPSALERFAQPSSTWNSIYSVGFTFLSILVLCI